MNGETLGERLRRWIKANHGTVSAFARFLEMSEETLRRYCQGKASPPERMLQRFAAAGLNPEWLLTGEGSPSDPTQVRTPQGRQIPPSPFRMAPDVARLECVRAVWCRLWDLRQAAERDARRARNGKGWDPDRVEERARTLFTALEQLAFGDVAPAQTAPKVSARLRAEVIRSVLRTIPIDTPAAQAFETLCYPPNGWTPDTGEAITPAEALEVRLPDMSGLGVDPAPDDPADGAPGGP